MAIQRSFTMTFNPILLFCLLAVINNVVILPISARQLKTSPDEKQVMVGTGNREDHHEVDPISSKNDNINMEKKDQEVDKNQFPPFFPYPLPFPPTIPGFPWPINPPPLDIPGVPSFPFPPFPPLDIPGIVPSSPIPVPSPPI